MAGAVVARRWFAWLALGGLGALLLIGLAPGWGARGPLVAAPASDPAAHAALKTLVSITTEIAPPARVGTPRLTTQPGLTTGWLAFVVAIGCSAHTLQSRIIGGLPSGFPPGRRGRALLYAYLN